MEINVARVNNGIYDVHVISDDEYIGPAIARGREWDAWMRRDCLLYTSDAADE